MRPCYATSPWWSQILGYFAWDLHDFTLTMSTLRSQRRAVFEIHKPQPLAALCIPILYIIIHYYTIKISPDFGVILAPDMCLDNVRHKCVTWYYFVWLCGIWHTHINRERKRTSWLKQVDFGGRSFWDRPMSSYYSYNLVYETPDVLSCSSCGTWLDDTRRQML